jgi:hypothetical protein
MSNEELARRIPVKPPRVKQETKTSDVRGSSDQTIGLEKEASQEKILIAVGIAMIIVADEKYNLESSDKPVMYM